MQPERVLLARVLRISCVPNRSRFWPMPLWINSRITSPSSSGSRARSVALLHATPEGETDPDDAPEPPQFAVSVPGDLWILGNHRLLCGDSTVLNDVERVMDGGLADLVAARPRATSSWK